MSDQNFVLEMRHITKTFPGVVALEDVDFFVEPGKVHALIGENGAGKSTLMKIIGGLYSAGEGSQIIFNGKKIANYSPRDAIDMGIAIIHQELSPVLDMTIAENIFLGQETSKFGIVEKRKLDKRATELMSQIGVNYDPNMKMRELTTSQMQMVEITKCVFRKTSLLIMDEPTSSLMQTEIERLFSEIKRLKENGVGIIYISHKMDEIFRIADDISVLRDGKLVSTGHVKEYTMERIITDMVGRKIDTVYPYTEAKMGDIMLELKNFTKAKKFKDVSFVLKKGEILGLTGLVGAGRTELVRAIFGLDPHDSGEILVDGKKVNIKKTEDALRHGIAMLSEDRKLWGLVLCRSVRENISLPNLRKMQHMGLLDPSLEKGECGKMIDKLNIKVASIENLISSLSGGNQQKVVLAKWLMRNVDILIMDEPTRGIDVAAKHEIYCIINDLARAGRSIIIISSEMPEIMGICDRILIMSNGSITGELDRSAFDQEIIMKQSMANL